MNADEIKHLNALCDPVMPPGTYWAGIFVDDFADALRHIKHVKAQKITPLRITERGERFQLEVAIPTDLHSPKNRPRA